MDSTSLTNTQIVTKSIPVSYPVPTFALGVSPDSSPNPADYKRTHVSALSRGLESKLVAFFLDVDRHDLHSLSYRLAIWL